jgi:eukaryotic-like serine/threonine-protein kinase
VSTFHQSGFERCALISGLLTANQLDEVRAALCAATADGAAPATVPSDQELADALVAKGLLNAWQAKQLCDGRTKFTLGDYRVIDSLGQGGMGHVYKGQDRIGRTVAIKVLPRDKCTPEAIANFSREIQAMASLNHPRLIRALDAGQDGKVYYLVTEYVPGCDLRKLVRRAGPLGMEAAASVIAQVADALSYAHGRGVVHRDVKPGNVLVAPDGEAKLSDLGLAGPMYDHDRQDPRYGKIVGTADYLSPDHIESPWNPAPTWDIYSLGCTLYYAVTGKVPFPGGTTADKVEAHRNLRPLDPHRLNHQLSDQFVDVLADMMAKDPAQRIASAAQVMERLSPWTTGKTSGAMPPVPPPLPAPAGATPPIAVVPPPRMQDTVSDVATSARRGSDSQPSIRLILQTVHRIPPRVLILLVLAPLGLVALAILAGWIWDVMF